MNILALDLSLLASGICLPDGSAYVFSTSEESGEYRMDEIAAHVRDAALRCDAGLVVLEDVFAARNSSAKKLCMLAGAVRLQLMRKRLPYVAVSPMALKKYATGGHMAKKADMRVALLQRTGCDVADDNACDATWLWMMAHDAYGAARVKMPEANRKAMAKVQWPVMGEKPTQVA